MPPPPTPPRPPPLDALLAWFRSHGGFLSDDVRVCHDGHHGVHVRVQSGKVVAPGTAVVECPHTLTFSYQDAISPDITKRRVWQKVADEVHREAAGWFLLIYHSLHREESKWKPYIDCLPDSSTLGESGSIFFLPEDAQELEWILGTNLHAGYLKRLNAWKQYYDRGMTILRDGGVDVTGYTWELFKWAALIFSSRSFPSKFYPNTDKESPFQILYPVADILNHGPMAEVDWNFSDTGSLRITIQDDYNAGDQVFNNYGPKPNDELLLGYGFCLADNPWDRVAITLKQPPAPIQDALMHSYPGRFAPDWDPIEGTFFLADPTHAVDGMRHEDYPLWSGIPEPLLTTAYYVAFHRRGLLLPQLTPAKEIDYDWTPPPPPSLPVDVPTTIDKSRQRVRNMFAVTNHLIEQITPQVQRIREHDDKLQGIPRSIFQHNAVAYRTAQLHILQSVLTQLHHATYVRHKLSLSEAITLLHPSDREAYLHGLAALTQSLDIQDVIDSENEDIAWMLFLCAVAILQHDILNTLPVEYLQQPMTDPMLAHYIMTVPPEIRQVQSQAAQQWPASFWASPRWTEAFVANWALRILHHHTRGDGPIYLLLHEEGDVKEWHVKWQRS